MDAIDCEAKADPNTDQRTDLPSNGLGCSLDGFGFHVAVSRDNSSQYIVNRVYR